MNPLETYTPAVINIAMVVLAITIFLSFLRTIIGPRMSDRVVGVNMIGTQAILLIGCLTLKLGEGWLVDVAIVYAMFSFLAVVVLTKMDIGVHREWRDNLRKSREQERLSKEQLAEEASAAKEKKKARREKA